MLFGTLYDWVTEGQEAGRNTGDSSSDRKVNEVRFDGYASFGTCRILRRYSRPLAQV